MTTRLNSGKHERRNTPVYFKVCAKELAALIGDGALSVRLCGGRSIPATYRVVGEEAEVCLVAPYIPANESPSVTLEKCGCEPEMKCVKTENGAEFYMRGKKFTEYYTGKNVVKPYLGPLCEAFGNRVTRLDFEIKEHPHHRSLWISHGDVNGIDFWNEPPEHGFSRNQEITDIVNGGAYAAFTAKNLWVDHGEQTPMLTEVTRYTLYNTPDEAVVIDVDITLSAEFGDVTLGATKEAGPIAIRMAESLKVRNTGTMVSGFGGINEKEIWMKRAPWIDYYGVENTHVCGVALLDHPDNYGFPTYWHARDYGLLAANNSFVPGPRLIRQGESANWKFRVVIHNGDTAAAGIAAKFEDFAFPPVVTVEEVK